MLVQLTPEDISREYHKIFKALEESIPSFFITKSKWQWNTFVNMQLGNIQVYKLVTPTDSIGVREVGMLITRLLFDDVFETNFLVIYGVRLNEKMDREFWERCAEGLKQEAIAHKCSRIEAYCADERIADISTLFGYTKGYHPILLLN